MTSASSKSGMTWSSSLSTSLGSNVKDGSLLSESGGFYRSLGGNASLLTS